MPYSATSLMSEFVTRDVKRSVISKPEGFTFDPGQGIELAIDEPNWRNESRPFTPTASHDDRVLGFTIKAYADHDGVTRRLRALEPGAGLAISEPFGTIRYAGKGIFVAAGACVTPFIAVLRQLARGDHPGGHGLIFSNKTPADVICEPELRHHLDERCSLTCPRESAPGYHAKRVARDYLAANIDDDQQRFYVGGPRKSVTAVNAALEDLGAAPEALVFER